MLIGAHVSTAGGLEKAVERGIELECESIQIFHQSPRMWRPTAYSEDDFEAFREAMEASELEAAVIHAVYLINCASKERDIRRKSLTSLKQALRVGDGIGAGGQQPLEGRSVAVAPLELRERPLIPIELEPAQRVEDLLDVLRGGALAVGVLDPQDELSAPPPGVEPVVQCRPRSPDVEGARR